MSPRWRPATALTVGSDTEKGQTGAPELGVVAHCPQYFYQRATAYIYKYIYIYICIHLYIYILEAGPLLGECDMPLVPGLR